MNDNQEREEQARKVDRFHDKYHRQKLPDWLRAEAEVEVTAETHPYDVEQRTIESEEQKQERIHKHLEGVIDRMEQVIDSPTEVLMKRIEVDAATIAVLAVVSELLPEPVQEQIRTIVGLHEKTWKIDIPVEEGETPRKPLPEELIDAITYEDDSSE
jgi:hypothetical protein